MRPSVIEIRLGAIYRFAACRGLTLAEVAALLERRCQFATKAAEQLAHHWFTTEAFR